MLVLVADAQEAPKTGDEEEDAAAKEKEAAAAAAAASLGTPRLGLNFMNVHPRNMVNESGASHLRIHSVHGCICAQQVNAHRPHPPQQNSAGRRAANAPRANCAETDCPCRPCTPLAPAGYVYPPETAMSVSSPLERSLAVLLQLAGMPHGENMLEACDLALRAAWGLSAVHREVEVKMISIGAPALLTKLLTGRVAVPQQLKVRLQLHCFASQQHAWPCWASALCCTVLQPRLPSAALRFCTSSGPDRCQAHTWCCLPLTQTTMMSNFCATNANNARR